MSDIVERLRAITGQAGDYGDVQLCDAAADEIERLRGYRDEAEAEASIASLAAQRMRLTDAERSAIGVAIQCVEAAMAQRHPEEEDARDLLHKTSCTLSRLFDRMTL